MHFQTVLPVIGKTAEKAARLRSSPLTFSSRSAANPRQNPGLSLKFLPGETHSETVVVGGDAVATRRFLGNNPPLAILAARGGSPVIFLRDLIGAAKLTSLAGSAVAHLPCSGKTRSAWVTLCLKVIHEFRHSSPRSATKNNNKTPCNPKRKPPASPPWASPPEILRSVTEAGYTEPTDVQTQAIPAAIAGVDLLVSSRTGSGKTAAFVLPALQRVIEARRDPAKKRERGQPSGPRVLVLAPTRELAMQVSKACSDLRPQRAGPARRHRRRRRALRGPAEGAARPAGHPDRHPGPPDRPHGQRQGDDVAGRTADPRRSRPHARHGLHRRHPPRSPRNCRPSARP